MFKFEDFKVSGDEIKICCPSCGGEYKLYLNFRRGVYNCFRCQTKGKIKDGLPNQEILIEHKKAAVEKIPLGCISITSSKIAKEFFTKRNLVPKDEFQFCEYGDYWQRVIIPLHFMGEYMGFQARTIHAEENCWCGQMHNDLKRYMTSRGCQIGSMLYNYDKVNVSICYLVEGVFNTLRLWDSVACFSKNLTETQANYLALKFTGVILALDQDAVKETATAGFKLLARGVKVFVLPLAKKDPAEHTLEELQALKSLSFWSWYKERSENDIARVSQVN